jgi:hypothetical protein
MRPFVPVVTATVLAAFCSVPLAAQFTRLTGVIERGGTSYTFEWDGDEVTVKAGDRVLSQRPAKGLGGAVGPWTGSFSLEDEHGNDLGSLSFSGDTAVVRVAPWRPMRASLDVGVEAPSEALAAQLGLAADEVLLVQSVVQDGAADQAGVRRFDLIVALDGARKVDQAKLREVLTAKKPGDELRLGVIRRGEEQEVVVKLGASESTGFGGAYDRLYGAWNPNPFFAARNQLVGPAAGIDLYDTQWLKLGQDFFTYSDPRWQVTTPDSTKADPTLTLADVAKRLAEIEELLKRLETKARSEAVR